MIRALKSAGIAPDDVSWLNAHGTGTPYNDKTETKAIKLAFGDAAYRVPVEQHQVDDGPLGRGGGRARGGRIGAGDARQHDPADDQPRHARPGVRPGLRAAQARARRRWMSVLSNSFGMGGQNATLVLRRFDDA